jgi:hypothetical protein
MLCLPGLQPVRNDDQATGLSGGKVVPSFLKQPFSRSLTKLGILPSSMYFSTSDGSMPSSPRMTTRLMRARFSALLPLIARHTHRTGQVKSKMTAEANATKKSKEGAEHGEPRTRADVGVRRRIPGEHGDHRQEDHASGRRMWMGCSGFVHWTRYRGDVALLARREVWCGPPRQVDADEAVSCGRSTNRGWTISSPL